MTDNFVAREISEGLGQTMRRLKFAWGLQYEFPRFAWEADFDRDALLDGADGVLMVPFT